ncbi:MAG: decaprenyl-phosphate phosphoribosyltransferase [Coriobacteriia bacterium]|nr:decaprenyl-phosphate phosphoribosyltransferase [Coriobacteriia bacterium]
MKNTGSTVLAMLRLMRPKQWVKNILVLFPLLFSLQLLDVPSILLALLACASFCLASSSVYAFNDIADRKKDRNHPKKCNRPVASGAVSVAAAAILGAILLVCAFVLAFFVSLPFMAVLLAYIVLNGAYSLGLKHVPIIDVLCVAAGFVLRVVAGAVAIDCFVSPWIVLCTFMLTLFLAIQKRAGEIDESDGLQRQSRKSLKFYTTSLLGDFSLIAAGLTIISYSLYTFTVGETVYMMLTIPFVVFGLFRYLMLAKAKAGVEAPDEMLFADKPLLIDVALWIVACALILYLT